MDIALFLGTPFLIGVVIAYIHNRGHPRSVGETSNVISLSLLVVCGSFVLFALEGIVCLAMAFPMALLAAVLGGQVGRAIAVRTDPGRWGVVPCLLLLPFVAIVDVAAPTESVREVITSVEIDAPIEAVWEEVVAFEYIDSDPEWFFQLGIAYPIEATIEGVGEGAIRRCEFSTGAFVEPITVWDQPHRLSFDVIEQPPALQEWSPYRALYTPHLDHYFKSVRGEFRLIAVSQGRTQLEGSTWYALHIYPKVYWTFISESILHKIHLRVLKQVQREAEQKAAVTRRIHTHPVETKGRSSSF